MAGGVETGRMDRRLDVGATLSEVFSTYGSQAGVLLPVAFWLFLVVAIVNGLISTSLALVPVALAVSLIAATLYQGMVVGLVRDIQDGHRDFSAGELMRSAAPVVGPLIGAGLLSGLGVGVGFVLFIVPGLFLLTIWAVIAPVIVIERSGVIAAFGRSRALVRGNGWPVFGAIFVVFLITAIAGLVLSADRGEHRQWHPGANRLQRDRVDADSADRGATRGGSLLPPARDQGGRGLARRRSGRPTRAARPGGDLTHLDQLDAVPIRVADEADAGALGAATGPVGGLLRIDSLGGQSLEGAVEVLDADRDVVVAGAQLVGVDAVVVGQLEARVLAGHPHEDVDRLVADRHPADLSET